MNLLTWQDHGGGCCGMTHIYGFDSNCTVSNLQTTIDNIRDENGDGSHLIEVTLTDWQLNQKNIRESVKACGFIPVNRFKNANSDNYVTVLHLITGRCKNTAKSSPFYKA